MNKRFIILFLFGFFFFSCSKEEDFKSIPDPNTMVLDSAFVISKSLYLWNAGIKEQKDFNPLQFKSPIELILEFRKYSPKNDVGIPIDQWSFAIDKESWNAILNGNASDFGCGFRFKDTNDLRISAVQQNSFAGKNGLYRGLQVLSINNIKATTTNIDLISEEFYNSANLSIDYLDKKTQTIKTILITKTPYIVEPIMTNKYFNVDNKKVGYINISTFINSVNDKLPLIFDDFKANAIDALIIDLRYNGGGLTSVMEDIANMLIPSSAVGKIMYTTKHNTDYEMFNSHTFFSESNQRLNLKTVYFIVSHNTASSSEMLINALKPYVNTVLVGQESQGKLVGMYTAPFHNYILAPVSFKTYNVNDESLEKNGFLPNFYAEDDVANDFDENEGCINIVLYHYKNNSFPPSKIRNRKGLKFKEEVLLFHDDLPFAVKEKIF